MKNNSTKELVVSVALLALAVLLLNPFHFWMPDMVMMFLMAIALVSFGIFATFVLRERVFDERDAVHRTLAGRNSFLVGSALLVIAIVIQEYREAMDPWLVIVFMAMILTKILTRVWSDRHY